MLLTKEVEVKVNSYTIDYYKSLGYEIPMKKASKEYARHTKKEYVYDLSKTFIVNVCDLLRGSSVHVDVLCDYCNETISSIWYSTYIETMEKFGGYACSNCRTMHQKKTCNDKYGCDNRRTQKRRSLVCMCRHGRRNDVQPELKRSHRSCHRK